MERSEPGWATTISREPEGKETRYSDGRGCGRHIRILLVSNTGE